MTPAAKPANPQNPAEYIASLAEPRRGEIAELHRLISHAIPRLKPWIYSGMIGYGTYHYRYASGREGDSPIVALSSRKQYISVYVCASENGQYLAESRKQDFPKASIGKSCIRFKRLAGIDREALSRIVIDGARILSATAATAR